MLLFFIKETLAANPNTEFKLFESQQYGESDLLFKDATQCFVHTSHKDYRSILGEEFYTHAETVFNCTHSGTTTTKIHWWIVVMHVRHVTNSNAGVYLTISCYRYLGVLQSGRVQHILTGRERKRTFPVFFSFSCINNLDELLGDCFCTTTLNEVHSLRSVATFVVSHCLCLPHIYFTEMLLEVCDVVCIIFMSFNYRTCFYIKYFQSWSPVSYIVKFSTQRCCCDALQ